MVGHFDSVSDCLFCNRIGVTLTSWCCGRNVTFHLIELYFLHFHLPNHFGSHLFVQFSLVCLSRRNLHQFSREIFDSIRVRFGANNDARHVGELERNSILLVEVIPDCGCHLSSVFVGMSELLKSSAILREATASPGFDSLAIFTRQMCSDELKAFALTFKPLAHRISPEISAYKIVGKCIQRSHSTLNVLHSTLWTKEFFGKLSSKNLFHEGSVDDINVQCQAATTSA